MASRVDTFVELAEDELTAIRMLLEQAAGKAQSLSNRWTALGKGNMTGWAEYNWAGKPYTAAELLAALNGLNLTVDTADAVTAATLNTAPKFVDRIVKASL